MPVLKFLLTKILHPVMEFFKNGDTNNKHVPNLTDMGVVPSFKSKQ